MDTGTQRLFLTEQNIRLHRDYLRRLKLEHSINEKSIPEIKGKSAYEISRMGLARRDKWEIIEKMKRIKAHECYFSSFGARGTRCAAVSKRYSSEDSFLYELKQLAKGAESGFLYVYKDERGNPNMSLSSPSDDFFIRRLPILALDLCEHAYFADYGFEYERYLENALPFLNLSRLL